MSYHGLGISFGASGECRLQGGKIVCSGGTDASSAPPPGGTPCPQGQVRLQGGAQSGQCCPTSKLAPGNLCCSGAQVPAWGGKCPPGWWIDNQLACCDPGGEVFTDPQIGGQILTMSYLPTSWSTTTPSPSVSAMLVREPTCLTPELAMFVAGCVAAPESCQGQDGLRALRLFQLDLPMCPGSALAPQPSCLDDGTQRHLAFCDTGAWKLAGGADSAACFLLTRNPGYYSELKQVPVCAPGEEPATTPEKKKVSTAMVVGGIAVAAVAGLAFLALRRKP